MKIEQVAKICHEANRALCETNGDNSQKSWDEAEQWQRDSAINGVKFTLDNPDDGEDAQHNSWMKEKTDEGWVYGEVKDPTAKTHPCIVPYQQLPAEQQAKDYLFKGIVNSLTKFIELETA